MQVLPFQSIVVSWLSGFFCFAQTLYLANTKVFYSMFKNPKNHHKCWPSVSCRQCLHAYRCVFSPESVAPAVFWLAAQINMHCEITHLLSGGNYVLDTLVDRFHYGVFMCIWLQGNVTENNLEWEMHKDKVSYYCVILSACVCMCRRTQWMGITCGWRRVVQESSVISERTPACWRLQWVVSTLTPPVRVCLR